MSVVTDVGGDDSGPTADLPPPSKDGVVEVTKDAEGNIVEDGAGPGGDTEKPFERTGWAPQFGSPNEKSQDAESLLDHSTWLEGKIPDSLYGDWYHNAAIIVFAWDYALNSIFTFRTKLFS